LRERARNDGGRLAYLGYAALLALTSCRACDTIPELGRECTAEPLVPQTVPDGGRNACIACIEDTPCCDAVGRCKDEIACALAVKGAHQCILDRGGGRAVEFEQGCLSPLEAGGPRAREMYSCMRGTCASECSLPVCRLDPAVPFAASPDCDNCFALRCCDEFNACAKNRDCLLALSCIVGPCKHELERTLDRNEAAETTALEAFFCGESSAPPFDDDDGGPPSSSCTDACIEQYLGRFDAPVSEQLRIARCLALRVRSCGARSDCGRRCVLDAGGRD
jgi:hypothetical protein